MQGQPGDAMRVVSAACTVTGQTSHLMIWLSDVPAQAAVNDIAWNPNGRTVDEFGLTTIQLNSGDLIDGRVANTLNFAFCAQHL